ncbi:acyl-coenzyme a:6-aminopenicillanic acid acyl-transferase domain-containing protein [Sarocladium implicatum]|nr:acyl-coenzyme a:6-aminopenicillanic acid acyl-transferase domain-containing protein [Sarocladium implicatum]
MLEIRCSGQSYQVGYQHGTQAKKQVHGSIAFYKWLFESSCSMVWTAVRDEAARYTSQLEKICPRYLEEMKGLADGAELDLLDIIALNVRTEIAFGLFSLDEPAPPSDGCTSMAHMAEGGHSVLAQNWDWQVQQGPNLVICQIFQPGLPDIITVTEAGIIGKIGLNSRGVGVCLNAIRARGLNTSQLPIHLALRTALESNSREEAIVTLKSKGIAGSGHILIADPTGSTGLECTSIGIREMRPNMQGVIVHANHLLLDHPGVDEPMWLDDSPKRNARLTELLQELDLSQTLGLEEVYNLFKDQDGFPNSIDRCQIDGGVAETLFNIVMDCTERTAVVTFGRVNAGGERFAIKLQRH